MADDPNLTSANTAANADPTAEKVHTQKITNADKVVGGVHLGAIDSVEYTSEQKLEGIADSVDKALTFKKRTTQSEAVLSAAAQLKQDFTGIGAYITARRTTERQVEQFLARQGKIKGADRLKTINTIIAERTRSLRMQEAQRTREAHLSVAKEHLRFATTVATEFMKQSLANQYRHLYTAKDHLKLTKAFAEMVENKLEAIKINTKLPDEKKKSLADHIKKAVMGQVKKHAKEILSKGSLVEAGEYVASQIAGVEAIMRNTKIGGKIADAVRAKTSGLEKKLAGITSHAKLNQLWNSGSMVRGLVVEHALTKKPGEHDLHITLHSNGATTATHVPENVQFHGVTTPHGPAPATTANLIRSTPGSTSLAAKNFERVYELVGEIRGSIDDFKAMYNQNSMDTLLALEGINDTLSKMPVYIAGSHAGSPIPGVAGAPGVPGRSLASRLPPGVHRAYGKVAGIVGKVTRPIGKVAGATGKIIGATATLATTLAKTGRHLLGAYGSYVKFTGKAVNAVGNFIFKGRDRSPYVDVYLKGNVKPGKPLVTGEQLRKGLVFGDGSRVLNVNQINQPVLDPRTGQTLITEDDLKTGLVDVFGKNIQNRKSRFSLLGGVFDVAKFGIGKAAGLAKPVIGMYAELFKMFPKIITGVGWFMGKTIVGILSGKAPGAIAKGLVGIAGSITKMYAQMFGLGLKGIGGVGKLFGGMIGRAFGLDRIFGKRKGGDVSKKDVYELVTRRLDNIYSLLDKRLANDNIRSGSYADHERREKTDEANLMHVRDEDKDHPKVSRGIMGRLAGLLGLGGAAAADDDGSDGGDDSDENKKDDGGGNGILNTMEGDAAYGLLGGAAAKAKSLGKLGLKGLKGLGGKLGLGKLLTSGIAAKILSKIGIKDLLKIGGKSLLKKIPGIGAVAGGVFAVQRAMKGDYLGAAGEAASGLVSLIPWVGTAASVGIDGWLAYRDSHKASTTASSIDPLLKARIGLYGSDTGKASVISDLEARTTQVVVSNGTRPITTYETRSYAQQFGFNPDDGAQLQYFSTWLDNRFRNIYISYLSVLKKNGYNITTNATPREADQKKILDQFNAMAGPYASKYAKYTPTPVGFKSNTPPAQPPGAASPFQSKTQAASNSNTPAAAAAAAVTPNKLPIVQAAYYPPSNIPTPANYNGTANIQQLSYTPPGGVQSSGATMTAASSIAGLGGYGTVNSAAQTKISSAETQKRAVQAVQFFMSNGWTKEQACGIVGSLIRESQLNTGAVGDGGAALGIAQWHSDRYNVILNALFPGKQMGQLSFMDQLKCVQWELMGPERHAASMLKTTSDAGTAGAYASKFYERPANTGGEMQIRAGLANSVYAMVGNIKGSPSQQMQVAANTNTPPSSAGGGGAPSSTPDMSSDMGGGGGMPSIPPAPPQVASATPQSMPPGYGPPSAAPTPATPSTPQQVAYQPPYPPARYPQLPYPAPPPGGYSPTGPVYPGQGAYPGMYAPVRGPIGNILNPIQKSLAMVDAVARGGVGVEVGGPGAGLQVQVTPHPEMTAAFQSQAEIGRASLAALGNLNDSVVNMHRHLQGVYSPNGVMGGMAENIANQQQPSGSPVIVAPSLSTPSPQCSGDNVGFGVKKKRDRRYAV
jgi:uncharacterized protein YoaH (UPF0181 family)